MKTIAVVCCMLMAAAQEAPVEVELSSGEVLRGAVIEQTSDTVVLQHELLGRLEIPASAVKEVRPAPPPEPAAEAPPPQPPAPPKAPPPVPPPKPRWKSTFSLGMTGSAGVTEDFDLRLGFNTTYTDPRQHYLLQSTYYYDSSLGDKTDNEAYVDFLAAWPFRNSPRWSWFVNPRYDFDEFQSWKHRL